MELLNDTKVLIEKVRGIQEREKELSNLRGESFNIFRLLWKESDEAGLHTKILFELLNPHGSHGKGSIFFDGFIMLLNENILPKEKQIPNYTNFQEIKRERYIGAVNNNEEEGGIIDLYFETNSFSLAIENKIFAGLGYKQLERYNSFQSYKMGKISVLFLLTPNENEGYIGRLEKDEDYFEITYRKTILKWLEFCHEKSSDLPILRETIKQYIISVKGILGMLTNQEMEKELEKLLLDNYEAANLIANSFNNVKNIKIRKMYQLLADSLFVTFSKTANWEVTLNLENIDISWGGFVIRKNDWIPGISIYFEGNDSLINGLNPGIVIDPKPSSDKISRIQSKFKKGFRNDKAEFRNLLFGLTHTNYKKFNSLLGSNKSIEFMAKEVHDFIVEVVNKKQKELLEIETILSE